LTQISHEEARSLINVNADQALDADNYSILNTHLSNCAECRSYASELNEVEIILRELSQKLDRRFAPLGVEKILAQSKTPLFGFANNITVTRMATMILAVIAVVIGVWQFSIFGAPSSVSTYTAIPIPTPSTYLTSTNATLLNCDYVLYQTHEGDTLESIAAQFSVPKDMVMEFNKMQEEKIQAPMLIRIPLCARTPTITIYPPNTTITITPQFEPITSTPG